MFVNHKSMYIFFYQILTTIHDTLLKKTGGDLFRDHILCARDGDEGERSSLCHSIQPLVHDHCRHPWFHHIGRWNQLRKVSLLVTFLVKRQRFLYSYINSFSVASCTYMYQGDWSNNHCARTLLRGVGQEQGSHRLFNSRCWGEDGIKKPTNYDNNEQWQAQS